MPETENVIGVFLSLIYIGERDPGF